LVKPALGLIRLLWRVFRRWNFEKHYDSSLVIFSLRHFGQFCWDISVFVSKLY